MPIAFPEYSSAVARTEKTGTMEIVFNPNIMLGQILEAERKLLIVTGITHRMNGLPTSKLSFVEPNWVWKFKYKVQRVFRHAWWWIKEPFRWVYRRARRG